MRLILSIIFIILPLFYNVTAFASSTCYSEDYFPSVAKIEEMDNGFRIHLGGKFHQDVRKKILANDIMPSLLYIDGEGWKAGEMMPCRGVDCIDWIRQCGAEMPEIVLSRKEAVTLRPHLEEAYEIEQKVSACTEYSGYVWFGIEFYEGEGVDGVGGVGRYNPKTRKMEIRRPELLRDSSINQIAYAANSLWIGTTGYYECTGIPPMHGLVRYEWDSDKIESFEGADDGPCGFVVHGLLWREDYLWVATDLGLSRWDSKKNIWENYLPDPSATPPIRKISCEDLYTDLLNSLPKDIDGGADMGSYYSLFFDSLVKFRPQFIKKYDKAKPKRNDGVK